MPAPDTVATDTAALARHLPDATRLARALRGDLDVITLAALRQDPARRYATVDAMSEDVHRYLRRERVPAAFPDDPRVRARLYTAIGTSYVAQTRMRAAAVVLDSALYLSRTSYGPQSDEFVEASIAAADAAMHRSLVPTAVSYSRAALTALRGREGASSEPYARALASMTTARYLAANLRGTDSLAQQAIAVELAWPRRLLSQRRHGTDSAHVASRAGGNGWYEWPPARGRQSFRDSPKNAS